MADARAGRSTSRAKSGPPAHRPAPAQVDLRGDPEELVDSVEFARIVGWGSKDRVIERLKLERQAQARRAAHPVAVALVGATPYRAPRPKKFQELSRAQRIQVVQAVAEILCTPGPVDPEFVVGLARRLHVPRDAVRGALAELARPPYQPKRPAPPLPEPDQEIPTGPVKHRYLWKRSTVWAFAQAERRLPPIPRRFTPEDLATARAEVLKAAQGGALLDAASLAKTLRWPVKPPARGLAKARTLLTQAVAELRLGGQVDLRTREQIAEQFELPMNRVLVLLRATAERTPPEPVIIASRIRYYLGEEVDSFFASAE